MVADLRITGTDDLARVARALKDAGDKDLRRELLRGINRALKPAKQAVKDAARSQLPQRGGLAAEVAASRISSSTRTSGRSPGVRVTGKKSGRDLRSIDRGRLRHPTFGRAPWVNQAVKPGFFSETLTEQAPRVRREVVDVLEDVAQKIASAG